MKFRKKPVVIDAFQWWPGVIFPEGLEGLHPLAQMTGENGEVKPTDKRYLMIKTLEGAHAASPGDWIIKGVKGEFYSCKPDIFEMTYELQPSEGEHD